MLKIAFFIITITGKNKNINCQMDKQNVVVHTIEYYLAIKRSKAPI